MARKQLRPPALVTRDGLGDCLARQLDASEHNARPPDRRALLAPEQPNTERRIAALFAAHPDLSPSGYWTGIRPAGRTQDYALRQLFDLDRESASVVPDHVDGFEWARAFLVLGCRRLTTSRSRKSEFSDRLARIASNAAPLAWGRHVPVGTGIVTLAALSLGIPLERAGDGPNARIAVRVMWEPWP